MRESWRLFAECVASFGSSSSLCRHQGRRHRQQKSSRDRPFRHPPAFPPAAGRPVITSARLSRSLALLAGRRASIADRANRTDSPAPPPFIIVPHHRVIGRILVVVRGFVSSSASWSPWLCRTFGRVARCSTSRTSYCTLEVSCLGSFFDRLLALYSCVHLAFQFFFGLDYFYPSAGSHDLTWVCLIRLPAQRYSLAADIYKVFMSL